MPASGLRIPTSGSCSSADPNYEHSDSEPLLERFRTQEEHNNKGNGGGQGSK